MAEDRGDVLSGLAREPAVAEAVDEARAAVDRLRAHRVVRRQGEKVAAESAVRGARASAALDRADLPLEAVRRMAQGDAPQPSVEASLARGALRVAAELGALQTTWTRSPLQVLARLHVLGARDLAPATALGRPRAQAADRLAALADVLARPSSAPAVVVAAVVHGELLRADAFADANGVVARAAARLVLVTRGLDPGALSAPEVGHVELGQQEYRDAATGYVAGGPDGVAGWLVHCARAVVLGAREGIAVCEAIQRGA